MNDDDLRTLGRGILMGQDVPTTASAQELRRAVELAIEDVSRRLAPYGYSVKPIGAQSEHEVEAQRDAATFREGMIIAGSIGGFFILVLIVVLVAKGLGVIV